ncbi:MAG TPA: IclR family transcriptional regulator [Clostridia bacterium]|nr:IclR family transcriptional regulator [Clostridia bacterium]
MPDYAIRILTDTLQVLELMAKERRGLTLNDFSTTLAMNKTRLFRILNTLSELDLVEQTGNAYILGWRLFEIGQTVPYMRGFRLNTHEILRQLSDKVGETANLGILVDGEILFIDVAEADRTLSATFKIGSRLPAHLTSIGKAILSTWTNDEIRQFFGTRSLIRHTPYSIKSVSELISQLERFRNQGWALDDQEFAEGVRCVASCIRNHSGRCVAAVSISGPAARITDERLNDIVPHLLEAARIFSEGLGWNDTKTSTEASSQPVSGAQLRSATV